MDPQFVSSSNGSTTTHEGAHQATAPLLSAPHKHTGKLGSPSPVSPKGVVGGFLPPNAPKIPNFNPQTQLTGAAAMAARQRSASPNRRQEQNKSKDNVENQITPNPTAGVLSNYPMSRPSDNPERQTSPSQKGLAGLPSIATAANAMATSGSSPGTATISANTNGSRGESGSTTATAGPMSATDPTLLASETNHPSYQPIALQTGRTGSIADFSATTPTTPAFTPTTPFSPSTPGGSRGRHTCPHCQQTFTRHHNLKSHLLTHSHEKPFFCQTCQARFRRLHDLKRHAKLHTGERPHECNKCGRKFARGDALARHARAEGGCAGRRSSMAGMMGEDGSIQGLDGEHGDMDGLDLIPDADGDIDMDGMGGGSDGSGNGGNGSRRRSLPSIRTNFADSPNPTQNSAPVAGTQVTPASSTGGFAQSTATMHHANNYPPLNTPSRTASTTPNTSLFPPPTLASKSPAKPPANSPITSSPLQTSTMMDSPRPTAPMMPTAPPNTTGDPWSIIRTMQHKIDTLEAKVAELNQQVQALKNK